MTDDELTERIATSLRKQRIAAGYSSYESFAEAAGMAPSRYYGYESGRRGLKVSDACKFADILGVTLDELVGRIYRQPDDELVLGPDDISLVKRYQSLDDRGRETVNAIIDVQCAVADSLDEADARGVGA